MLYISSCHKERLIKNIETVKNAGNIGTVVKNGTVF